MEFVLTVKLFGVDLGHEERILVATKHFNLINRLHSYPGQLAFPFHLDSCALLFMPFNYSHLLLSGVGVGYEGVPQPFDVLLGQHIHGAVLLHIVEHGSTFGTLHFYSELHFCGMSHFFNVYDLQQDDKDSDRN